MSALSIEGYLRILRAAEANFGDGRPLPEPTDAPPGSPEKVKILAVRRKLRQCLWHPADVTRLKSLLDMPIRKRERDHDNGVNVFAPILSEEDE